VAIDQTMLPSAVLHAYTCLPSTIRRCMQVHGVQERLGLITLKSSLPIKTRDPSELMAGEDCCARHITYDVSRVTRLESALRMPFQESPARRLRTASARLADLMQCNWSFHMLEASTHVTVTQHMPIITYRQAKCSRDGHHHWQRVNLQP
jgi:hypothetical protein